MLIEVLYMPGCPNHQPALHRLRKALQFEAVDVAIREIPVSDEATARSLRFPGSPTVRINGQDAEPSEQQSFCHQKKHYNAPFLRQRTTSEAYEGLRKGSACRSHCCRPFNPCLLCAAGIPRGSGTGKHECLGATPAALAARGIRCAFVLRLCTTLLQEVCVQQTKYCEFGSLLDRRRCSGSSDFISPGNCQRGRWLVSSRLEWRKENTCSGLLP